MPRRQKVELKCPICKHPVQRTISDFPFCSERCRLIDLGKWASGQYVVSSPALDEDNGTLTDASGTDDDE